MASVSNDSRSCLKLNSIHQREEMGGGGGGGVSDPSQADGRRKRSKERGESSRRRINELEKEKLELTSSHNEQLRRLEAELTRLRSTVERGDAQRAELQYQLTMSQRETHTLTERAAALQETTHELQRALDIIQDARQQDKAESRQEVEERDGVIQNVTSENRRLHRLLQVLHQKAESLEAWQRRAQALEADLAVQRSDHQEVQRSLQQLRRGLREVERQRSVSTERLQKEFDQCRSDLTVALETERKLTSDFKGRLEEERRCHTHTHSLLEQAVKRCSESDEMFTNFLNEMRKSLNDYISAGCGSPAEDGKLSPSAEVLQLLKTTLTRAQVRQEETDKQLNDLLVASEHLHEENQTLRRRASDQMEVSARLRQEVTRLRQENSDWSTLNRGLQVVVEKERKRKEEEEEEREEEEQRLSVQLQRITDRFHKESQERLSFLHSVYQRLLTRCLLLPQPPRAQGNFTWEELCDVINEQLERVTSDLQTANNRIFHLQRTCEKKSVRVQKLQRRHQCVLLRVVASVRRREAAWSRRHTQLQSELQDVGCQRRRESACFLSLCSLLARMALSASQRLHAVCEQKTFLRRRLAIGEELEVEVRGLVLALGGEKQEGGRSRRTARSRWRRTLCVVLAVSRWRLVIRKTAGEDGGGEGLEGPCARWLHSRHLSTSILSSMADLQGALECTGTAPPGVMSTTHSALSHVLNCLLNQSDASSTVGKDTPTLTLAQPHAKALVSSLQQHFLLFSQRLHTSEVERRSLRLQVANLKKEKGDQREDRLHPSTTSRTKTT